MNSQNRPACKALVAELARILSTIDTVADRSEMSGALKTATLGQLHADAAEIESALRILSGGSGGQLARELADEEPAELTPAQLRSASLHWRHRFDELRSVAEPLANCATVMSKQEGPIHGWQWGNLREMAARVITILPEA